MTFVTSDNNRINGRAWWWWSFLITLVKPIGHAIVDDARDGGFGEPVRLGGPRRRLVVDVVRVHQHYRLAPGRELGVQQERPLVIVRLQGELDGFAGTRKRGENAEF